MSYWHLNPNELFCLNRSVTRNTDGPLCACSHYAEFVQLNNHCCSRDGAVDISNILLIGNHAILKSLTCD